MAQGLYLPQGVAVLPRLHPRRDTPITISTNNERKCKRSPFRRDEKTAHPLKPTENCCL